MAPKFTKIYVYPSPCQHLQDPPLLIPKEVLCYWISNISNLLQFSAPNVYFQTQLFITVLSYIMQWSTFRKLHLTWFPYNFTRSSKCMDVYIGALRIVLVDHSKLDQGQEDINIEENNRDYYVQNILWFGPWAFIWPHSRVDKLTWAYVIH